MQGKASTGGMGIDIDAGVEIAVLKEVQAWTADKYQSDEQEVILCFVWELEDNAGELVTLQDNFVRLTRDRDGFPVLNENSKLYNRLAALYGREIAVAAELSWEIEFPRAYDSPEGLETLPHFSQRRDIDPVKVKAIVVEGVALLGREAQINIVEKNGYMNVKDASAMPRRKAKPVRDLEPIREEEGVEALPV